MFIIDTGIRNSRAFFPRKQGGENRSNFKALRQSCIYELLHFLPSNTCF